MPLKVRVIFTGICAILRSDERVLLPNALRTSRSCDGSTIPAHHAYIRYRLSENKLDTPFDVADKHDRAAIFLNGDEILITSNHATPPARPGKIDNVAAMEDIFPNIQLSPAARQPPTMLSHNLVAGYFALNKGKFSTPSPSQKRRWHFFPQKASPVHGPLAQGVTYRIDLEGSELRIALRPFGSGTTARDILWLVPKEGNEVTIIIGNTPHDDIFPPNETKEPPRGPDPHFEVYYRLAMNAGGCPLPIPHYDGEMGSGHGGHGGGHGLVAPESTLKTAVRFAAAGIAEERSVFDSLGGANCPPSQWP